MVIMDGEIEGERGGEETLSEETDLSTSNHQEEIEVIQEILSVIESVARLGDFRRTQRKESYTLVRRMKLLLPLLEEIRDIHKPPSETGIASLCSLKRALLMAKKLLRLCNEGSKIYLALETEAVMVRFYATYEKLSQALSDLPYDELGISDEVREQVELMSKQLKRAKRRTDTQDIELAMDMMVTFSKNEDRNVDSAVLERLAKKLDLHSVEDLKNETIAVRNLIKEKGVQNSETIEQIIDLLNKFKQVAGVEISNVLDDPVMPKMQKCRSLVIPHEFLCPITLEIMTDPVIIASGQTYERESIQKWFESNHRTCPKTRQALAHTSLAPNYALKNIIIQWCDKNNFKLPKKEDSAASESSTQEQKEEILNLVEKLHSSQLDVQRNAVKKIRLLSKENPENRILIANSGGIPPLVQLLSYPDTKILEHSVTALLNLSIDETNKRLIAEEEAIPAIIQILENGSSEQIRENSAAALFSLSMLDENKTAIGLSNGIPPLVELLQNGTIRGKQDAATALFNLCLNSNNKDLAIEAGIVLPLLHFLDDKTLGMVDEALSIFLLIASHPKGRQEIGQLPFIETLVEFIREGTPKNKECATALLLELGSTNSSFILAALQYGVYEHLIELTKSGTNRAQRKANALIQLMCKSEQI